MTHVGGAAAAAGLLAVATAVSAAVPATAAGSALAGPTVVAQWHLDEQPGATVMADSSGFGHSGMIGSDVVLGVPGVFGTAYSFTGGQPIVRVPTSDDLNPHSLPLTISAYLNVSATLTAGDYNVIQKGQATTTGGAYKLEVFGQTTQKFGYPDCAFNSPGGFNNRVYGPTRINDGAWHHVECHLTDTQAYVTVDGSKGPAAARVVGSIANSTDLTLGGKPNDTHFFSGRADEVSITIGDAVAVVSAPVVTAGSTDALTPISATLHGTLNPGNADTTYRFTYTPSGGATSSTQTATITAGSDSVPVQVQLSGLTPGTDYAFSLVATNVAGTGTANGAFSTPVSGAVTPGPVTSVTVVSGPTTDTPISVIVKWAAPPTGAAPTGYLVTVTDQSTGLVSAPVTVSASVLRVKVSGLVLGHSYTGQVTAFDSAGDGSTTSSTMAAVAQ